jgi:hypothetical protein
LKSENQPREIGAKGVAENRVLERKQQNTICAKPTGLNYK